jgi:hypothetical protein
MPVFSLSLNGFRVFLLIDHNLFKHSISPHQQFGNLDSGFSWFLLVSGLPETWKLGDSAQIELKCENY